MAGLQPATRRLLTEATAAAVYRTAAQTATDADARIALKRGAANGVAALGADGIVPATQLPVVANPTRVAVNTATVTSATTVGTYSDVVALAAVTAGRYAVEADVFLTGSAALLLAVTNAGDATAVLNTSGTTVNNGVALGAALISGTTSAQRGQRVFGVLTVTATTTLTVRVGTGAAGSSGTAQSGTVLRLTPA